MWSRARIKMKLSLYSTSFAQNDQHLNLSEVREVYNVSFAFLSIYPSIKNDTSELSMKNVAL